VRPRRNCRAVADPDEAPDAALTPSRSGRAHTQIAAPNTDPRYEAGEYRSTVPALVATIGRAPRSARNATGQVGLVGGLNRWALLAQVGFVPRPSPHQVHSAGLRRGPVIPDREPAKVLVEE